MSDRINGEFGDDASNAIVGNSNKQYIQYASTATWREFVRRDLEALRAIAMALLIAVIVLFALGFVTTGFMVRERDFLYGEIRELERRIQQPPAPYWYPGTPLP